MFKNTDEYKHMFSMTAITMELSITISFFLLSRKRYQFSNYKLRFKQAYKIQKKEAK